MLHLDSSNKLPSQTREPSHTNLDSNIQKEPAKKSKIVTISNLSQLSFEKFLFTDMRKFYAQIESLRQSIFGPTEYMVEIRISDIPPFRVGKTYEQFRAFYKALKLRFPNIRWPEFPPHFQFVKKFETRKAAFNQMLDEICIVARMQDTYKKSILGIFYAFFLDRHGPEKVKFESVRKAEGQNIDKKKLFPNASVIESQDNPESTWQLVENVKVQLEKHNDKEDDDKSETSETTHGVDPRARSARKFCLEDPTIQEGRQQRCLSFENHSKHNISSLEDEQREISRSFMDMTSSDKDSFRKMSIDEGGYLENERKQEIQSPKSATQNKDLHYQDDSLKNISNSLETVPNNANTADSLSSPDVSKTNVAHDEVTDQANKRFLFTEGSNNKQVTSALTPQTSPKLDAKPSPTIIESSVTKSFSDKDNISSGEKEGVSNKEVKEIKRTVVTDMEKLLKEEVPKFAGNIYLRLSGSPKWTKYFARIQKSCLLLYPTILDTFPHHFIPCFKAVIKYVSDPLAGDYIEFYHRYDAEKFYITTDITNNNANNIIDPTKNLEVWCAQLKIASEKVSDINLSESYYYEPVGKLQIVVCDAQDIKGLPPKSSCFFRISHKPFVLQTSKALSGHLMRWKQSFFLPICDVFFPITLELVCSYNDGWITESQKEEVICSVEIPFQDLMSVPNGEALDVTLPLKYTEARKPKALKTSAHESELNQPKLKLKINNVSSVKSYFASAYGDYVEGVKMDSDTFTKQFLKLSLARMRRIISYIILVIRDIRDIFHHKYPIFSYLCILLFTYLIVSFDVSDIISNFLLILAILCFYKHPKVEPLIKSFMIRVFFNESDINPNYREPQIQTLSELDLLETFNIEKWRHKLRDDESLVSQLKKAKKSVVILTIIITKISGFCEKLKNLVLWQDERRSLWFSIFTLIGYCIFAVVPLRFVILIAVWSKFAKGIFYYKNLRQKNRQIASNTITFILKKYFYDLHEQVSNSLTSPWPSSVNFIYLQKKMVEQLKYRLEVDVGDDLLQTYKTPEELISALETCRTHLKFKEDIIEEAKEIQNQKEPKFKPGHIFNFVMNVPSDYYRVIQPRVVPFEAKKHF